MVVHDPLVTAVIVITAGLTMVGLLFMILGDPGAINMVLGCSIPCAITIGAWYGPQINKESKHE